MANEPKYRKKRATKEQRLHWVAEFHRKGLSISKIGLAVADKLGMTKTISKSVIFNDIKELLNEWRSVRVSEIELMMEEQLQAIDTAVEELWQQWEKSKTDYKAKTVKRTAGIEKKSKRKPRSGEEIDDDFQEDTAPKITPLGVENTDRDELMLGDPRYISEIRAQLAEKRKLLGLYAPDKQDITSKGEGLSKGFYDFLKKVNTVDE